jgi:hypothetical protein
MSSTLAEQVIRATAALEARTGIPTDALKKIAKLPLADRPAALAKAAIQMAGESHGEQAV